MVLRQALDQLRIGEEVTSPLHIDHKADDEDALGVPPAHHFVHDHLRALCEDRPKMVDVPTLLIGERHFASPCKLMMYRVY